jgi:hypothetical protein
MINHLTSNVSVESIVAEFSTEGPRRAQPVAKRRDTAPTRQHQPSPARRAQSRRLVNVAQAMTIAEVITARASWSRRSTPRRRSRATGHRISVSGPLICEPLSVQPHAGPEGARTTREQARGPGLPRCSRAGRAGRRRRLEVFRNNTLICDYRPFTGGSLSLNLGPMGLLSPSGSTVTSTTSGKEQHIEVRTHFDSGGFP